MKIKMSEFPIQPMTGSEKLTIKTDSWKILNTKNHPVSFTEGNPIQPLTGGSLEFLVCQKSGDF